MAAKRKGVAKTATPTRDAGCTITNRGMVVRIVLDFVRRTGFPNAVENSDFTSDIPVSSAARAAWATALSAEVRQRGCDPTAFTPSHTRDAQTVGDIVNALWSAIRSAEVSASLPGKPSGGIDPRDDD